MKYNKEEQDMIIDFTEYVTAMKQLKRLQDGEEINITPLVKLYSVFLEDGQSLQDMFDQLNVELSDIEDIIGGI